MFLACNVAQEKQSHIWYLDLGCSNHMSGNIEMFSNLDESVKYKLTLWTDNKVFVMGKGRVDILTKKGYQCRHHQLVAPIIFFLS